MVVMDTQWQRPGDNVALVPWAQSLTIHKVSRDEALLSWFDPGTNAILETAARLFPTTNWIPADAVPVMDGNWFHVTNIVVDPVRFFRLKKR